MLHAWNFYVRNQIPLIVRAMVNDIQLQQHSIAHNKILVATISILCRRAERFDSPDA